MRLRLLRCACCFTRRYVPRPVEGDVVYTDYYGRYGPEHANYYGRSYHLDTAEVSRCCTAWVSLTPKGAGWCWFWRWRQQGCQAGVSGWPTAHVSTGGQPVCLVLAFAEHCMHAGETPCYTHTCSLCLHRHAGNLV
jgi:hypothetical protein